MRLIKASSPSYPKWIEFSAHHPIHSLLRDILSSLSPDFSEKWGKNDLLIGRQYLDPLANVIRATVTRLLGDYAPGEDNAEDHTHVVEFESRTLYLNVRRPGERLIAHLLLVLDMTEHSIKSDEGLTFEVRED